YELYPIKNAQAVKEDGEAMDELGVTVEDEKTLVVELEQTTPYFLNLTAFDTYYPMNENVADVEDLWAVEATDKNVTDCAFTMESWEHKDQIVLKKNEDYWDAETVSLETINMFMVKDESTELKMFEQGELDWAGDPTGSIPLASIPS